MSILRFALRSNWSDSPISKKIENDFGIFSKIKHFLKKMSTDALQYSFTPDQIKQFQAIIKAAPRKHELKMVPREVLVSIPNSPYTVTLKVESKYRDVKSGRIAFVELEVYRYVQQQQCCHTDCWCCISPSESATFKTSLMVFIDQQYSILIEHMMKTEVSTVYDDQLGSEGCRKERQSIEDAHCKVMEQVAGYVASEFVPRLLKSIGVPFQLG